MPKLLLPIAAALAVTGATAGGATYLLTRGAAVEEVPPPAAQASPEPSPAATETPSATATPEATPTPTVASEETPSATADWKTYTDPGGLFTVRYPSTWFQKDGSLYSTDPDTVKGEYDPPPGIVEVETQYYEAVGSSACGGALTVDPTTGKGTPVAGATPAILGTVAAWQLVRGPGDPAIEGNLTRIQGVSAIYKGHCINVAAYFTQENPDVATFDKIVESFRFAD